MANEHQTTMIEDAVEAGTEAASGSARGYCSAASDGGWRVTDDQKSQQQTTDRPVWWWWRWPVTIMVVASVVAAAAPDIAKYIGACR